MTSTSVLTAGNEKPAACDSGPFSKGDTKMSTPSSTTIPESKCASPSGCQFIGPDSEFYMRGDVKLCGKCMDRLDDDLPHLTSQFGFNLLKALYQ